jgi:uncharacterized protein (DUF934 family)
MPKIIRNRRIVDDGWQLLDADALLAPGEDGFVPEIPAGDVVAPLGLWRLRRDELIGRPGRTGVLLPGSEEPEAIAPMLAQLALVAVRFDRFSDGRGYSLARLLRERYGWRGELRASGDIGRDQLLYLERCGFDSFEPRGGEDARAALAAFAELSEQYQLSATAPLPLFRRRAATPAEARGAAARSRSPGPRARRTTAATTRRSTGRGSASAPRRTGPSRARGR